VKHSATRQLEEYIDNLKPSRLEAGIRRYPAIKKSYISQKSDNFVKKKMTVQLEVSFHFAPLAFITSDFRL